MPYKKQLLENIGKWIFFPNYFLGILGVTLCYQDMLVLHIRNLSVFYYLTIFCAIVAYYSVAYLPVFSRNYPLDLRAKWYKKYLTFNYLNIGVNAILAIYFFYRLLDECQSGLKNLPFKYYGILILLFILLSTYYFFRHSFNNVRRFLKVGYLKPFIIGLIWATITTILPEIFNQLIEVREVVKISGFNWILFLVNFCLCSSNAILFDWKDYKVDKANGFETIFVKFGFQSTILIFICPMIFVSIVLTFYSCYFFQISNIQTFTVIIPYLIFLGVANDLQKLNQFWVYVVVLDGLILLKALVLIFLTLL